MLETLLEMIGLGSPKKPKNAKGKSGKKKKRKSHNSHRTHTDYMNSYSYQQNKKALKETERAYGRLSADINYRNH